MLHFRDAKAGLVPLPLKRSTDVAEKAAEKTNISLKWQQNSGDPVALIQIPEQVEDVEGRLIVENIEVRDGEVYLSGRTVKPDGSGGNSNVPRAIAGQLFNSNSPRQRPPSIRTAILRSLRWSHSNWPASHCVTWPRPPEIGPS